MTPSRPAAESPQSARLACPFCGGVSGIRTVNCLSNLLRAGANAALLLTFVMDASIAIGIVPRARLPLRRRCDTCGATFNAHTPEPTEPVCGRCGYNLTGNVSGVCPECGWRIARRVRALIRRAPGRNATAEDPEDVEEGRG